MLVSPSWAKQFPQLIIGQTTRNGGVSQVPYKSFNLGLFTQDKYDSVQENRRRLANYVGISVENWAGGHQVHGSAVRLVKSPMACEGYDAFITTVSGVLLTVTVADCIPVLLYDPVSNSCGAAHAGWRGTVANIVGKTLQAMVEQFSVAPENCYAYVGTGISQPNFEVSHDVAE
ncbi:MAG: polyphenol oxidase family protein, partial [Bacteroidota bacterium]